MHNAALGRGIYIYAILLLLLNIAALIVALFFVDMETFKQASYYPKFFATLGALFVLELVVFVVWNACVAYGWKRSLLVLVLAFVIATVSEILGVNYGLIFGSYHYTGILGFELWGFPVLVGVTWASILYITYCLTDILIPARIIKTSSILQKLPVYLALSMVAAFATTAWDMLIDPIAVDQGWWVWDKGGSYMPYIENGVPVQNFVGWWGVSFICQIIFRFILNTDPQPRRSLYLSVYSPGLLYFSMFLTAFGAATIFTQRPGVALTGMMGMGFFVALTIAKLLSVKQGIEIRINSQ
ncbi:MAG: carotenoid biosynthesis protein [Deltaproteobacteria bacterium]|nr:carotenoid biosynthesis protein [Deltaproteobacteria bacterium]